MARTAKGLLLDQILVHPGQQYLDLIDAHSLSYWIFNRNAAELRQLVSSLEDPKNAEDFFSRNSHKTVREVHDEVSRRLHNLTAASKTLVDHTQTLMNDPRIHPDHKAAHQTRVSNFIDGVPAIKFMHDLRNYTLHRSIPWTGIKISKIVGRPAEGSVNIDLDTLENWEKWTAPSREFIKQHKPHVRILQLLDSYEHLINNLYKDFPKEFEAHYTKEIAQVRTLWRQFNEPDK